MQMTQTLCCNIVTRGKCSLHTAVAQGPCCQKKGGPDFFPQMQRYFNFRPFLAQAVPVLQARARSAPPDAAEMGHRGGHGGYGGPGAAAPCRRERSKITGPCVRLAVAQPGPGPGGAAAGAGQGGVQLQRGGAELEKESLRADCMAARSGAASRGGGARRGTNQSTLRAAQLRADGTCGRRAAAVPIRFEAGEGKGDPPRSTGSRT